MARTPYVSFRVSTQPPGRRARADDILDGILRAVRAGHLPPGSRLPPVRVLEHQLGLSKNTAQAAYDELCARGVLTSRARDGVFVAESSPHDPRPALAATPPLPALRSLD